MIHNIRMNSALRDFLNARHIHPKVEEKPRLDRIDRLIFSDDLHVSAWSRHFLKDPKTLVLGSLGYMTYAYSPAHRFSAGAFCSVATGVTMMGDRHPTHRVSTHPFTYGAFYLEAARELGASENRMHVAFDRKQQATTVMHDVWIGARL